ncbi:16S rRNA (uracil(1498)-N(3))-methyltransferase [Streptomyces sp. DSM 44917]|uniref:Ribosomal RNA small subunit methyltransferase E n=1 Tax=Streptomyces boetiae TaxID=3075541 RepID=A0ABU2L845_9ACTN|nr:16S rRNA (uracil(1498)-N(3))-methyltransferase [Streptomyces sp. DSM 44917]MDT0307468.1 16S rRNA (uracil(1498)-N(3))-methyltransferase [Streptomyces sp. DSM 44917]
MSTAPVFLSGALSGAGPGALLRLDGPEGRHAVTVRRLRPGEEIVLTDGAGTAARGTVAAVTGKDSLDVAVEEAVAEPAPDPWLTVVQALPKGDRGELAVETMSETGVDAIVPWAAARCVTQWKGERGERALAKWRAAAREAGKQARRARFCEVAEPVGTREAARGVVAGAAFAAVLHESATEPLATAPLPTGGRIVLIVGPEGGVTDQELAAFAEAGARPCRLGPTVLRTSTAGTAAAALLLGRTGRWS